jgi:hypothetical protein
MFGKLNLRRRFGVVVALPLLACLVARVAAADSAAGKITVFHMNGEVADRGVCFQMIPAVAGQPWMCLYKDNYLYKEITSTLMAAYLADRPCTITWNTLDANGFKKIAWITC